MLKEHHHKQDYLEKKIIYFNAVGKENTDHALKLAKERFDDLGLKKVIVATSFGNTGVKALEYFKGEELVVVNSMYGFREPGKESLEPKNKKKLQDSGVTLVYTTHLFAGIDRSITRRFSGITPTQLIGQVFKMLGEGFKVSTEIAIMAADCGAVPVDKEVIAIGGTGRGCDTAIVIIPSHSNNFFNLQFKEIICMPRIRHLKDKIIL